jgi:hypothetical protein
VFDELVYGYAALWFTTPFFLASMLTSLLDIAIYRYPPATRHRTLPPYPTPQQRTTPLLVLGETHLATQTSPAPSPTVADDSATGS